MQTPDVIPAVRSLLLDTFAPDVAVYGEELPHAAIAEGTPPRAVVVSSAGDPEDRGFATLGRTRLQIRCYSPTPAECRALWRTVNAELKFFTARAVDDVKVLSFISESGIVTARDPDTQWPFATSIWLVMARDIPVETGS